MLIAANGHIRTVDNAAAVGAMLTGLGTGGPATADALVGEFSPNGARADDLEQVCDGCMPAAP
jgi:hypothetical protein